MCVHNMMIQYKNKHILTLAMPVHIKQNFQLEMCLILSLPTETPFSFQDYPPDLWTRGEHVVCTFKRSLRVGSGDSRI
jgi:hypothetical protein